MHATKKRGLREISPLYTLQLLEEKLFFFHYVSDLIVAYSLEASPPHDLAFHKTNACMHFCVCRQSVGTRYKIVAGPWGFEPQISGFHPSSLDRRLAHHNADAQSGSVPYSRLGYGPSEYENRA